MHKRKRYLIYPPNYKPGDGYKVRFSKFQAWKVAVRMGHGSGIDVEINTHVKRRAAWISSRAVVLYGWITR